MIGILLNVITHSVLSTLSTDSCVEDCGSDNPCSNNLLCCSNGCGRSCMPRMIVAPLCPALQSTSGGIGAFVPQCEDDGSFSSVQCWGSTGYCWCVESTSGRPVTEGIRGGEPECPGKLDVYACRATPPACPKFQYYVLFSLAGNWLEGIVPRR